MSYDGSISPGTDSFSLPWLRLQLARLKAGTPVDGRILPSLTIGMERLESKLSELLEKRVDRRWMALVGDFGEGKSHFLNLSRHTGHSRGWAVCNLVANISDGSLAHPQRHLQFVLDTMHSPYGSGVGLVELFREWWESSRRSAILEFANTFPRESPIAQHLIGLEEGSIELDIVCEYLGGKYLGARAGSATSRKAFRKHLEDITSLLIAVGHKGLLVLIDEIESVFRLSNYPSWIAALRSLGSYCCDPRLRNVVVVFVSTFEARQKIQKELSEILKEVESQMSTADEEKAALKIFVEQLDRHGWHRCHRLDPEQRKELANSIARLHAVGNGSKSTRIPPSGMLDWISEKDISIRQAVRTLVAWLDSYT